MRRRSALNSSDYEPLAQAGERTLQAVDPCIPTGIQKLARRQHTYAKCLCKVRLAPATRPRNAVYRYLRRDRGTWRDQEPIKRRGRLGDRVGVQNPAFKSAIEAVRCQGQRTRPIGMAGNGFGKVGKRNRCAVLFDMHLDRILIFCPHRRHTLQILNRDFKGLTHPFQGSLRYLTILHNGPLRSVVQYNMTAFAPVLVHDNRHAVLPGQRPNRSDELLTIHNSKIAGASARGKRPTVACDDQSLPDSARERERHVP